MPPPALAWAAATILHRERYPHDHLIHILPGDADLLPERQWQANLALLDPQTPGSRRPTAEAVSVGVVYEADRHGAVRPRVRPTHAVWPAAES